MSGSRGHITQTDHKCIHTLRCCEVHWLGVGAQFTFNSSGSAYCSVLHYQCLICRPVSLSDRPSLIRGALHACMPVIAQQYYVKVQCQLDELLFQTRTRTKCVSRQRLSRSRPTIQQAIAYFQSTAASLSQVKTGLGLQHQFIRYPVHDIR